MTIKVSAKSIPKSECLGELNDGTYIYEVDGNYVRSTIGVVEWIGGGHYLEDDFIEDGEIWVEEMPEEEDETAIVVHEAAEYMLMRYARMGYSKAHELANSLESIVRGCDGELNEKEEKKTELGDKKDEKDEKMEKNGLGKKVMEMLSKRNGGKKPAVQGDRKQAIAYAKTKVKK